MTQALSGILVVALEQAVAAPLCTARLAEAGARVIKIERREGDFARGYDSAVRGESAYFVWINQGKESLLLDLKNPADVDLLSRVVARADVFVQNLAPGAAARAGFGAESLRRRHPRLITCDITGFGEDGPMRDRKAYDLLIQCETGLASITGTAAAPGRVGVSIADIACGMYAHAAILEALLQRERTGAGTGVSVSLFDALSNWMSVPLLQADYSGKTPQRVGLAHPSIAPYGAFETADGRQLVISVQNEREWRQLCQHFLGQTELALDLRFATNSARVAHRLACDALIAARFRQLGYDEAVALLTSAGVAFGAVNSVDEFRTHPHLRRMAVQTPSGDVQVVAPPTRWAGAPPLGRAVPGLGEHDAALRREFDLPS